MTEPAQPRSPREYAKRYAVLLCGLVVMAYGIALSIISDLGTSPISSLPYVLSEMTPMTVGIATIGMHATMIAAQVFLLGRRFEKIQMFQLPLGIVFGLLIDFALWTLDWMTYSSYAGQWVIAFAGMLILAFGVSLQVLPDVLTLAGEGLVLAITRRLLWSERFRKFGNFGAIKVAFDSALVAIASVLSLVVLGKILGVREGTVLSMILVGEIVRRANRAVGPTFERFFKS